MIKAIQRIQKELLTNPIVEELFEIEEVKDVMNDSTNQEDTDQESECENNQNISPNIKDKTNPYRGIRLEKEINIDKVFKRTADGLQVMEQLKQNATTDDKLFKKIQVILCNFLQFNFGIRPSAFHKNLTALSLVNCYPSLRAVTLDTPQALWFHPHARGKHRHAGRLHYHLEYLVRKSSDRVIKKSKPVLFDTQATAAMKVDEVDVDAENIEDMINELKFICPGPNTKKRAEELWLQTYINRHTLRNKGEFHLFLQDNPVATCFNGELLALDFQILHPHAQNFWAKLENLQSKILAKFPDLLSHVNNDTVRALSIVRLKNPSRGVKRVRDTEAAKENRLAGIVEWIQIDDPIPMTNNDTPVLYMRGKFPEDNESGVIMWRNCAVPLDRNFPYCFEKYCQTMAVFNTSGQPSDKQFFVFIMSTLFGIDHLTTTGEKFMRILN